MVKDDDDGGGFTGKRNKSWREIDARRGKSKYHSRQDDPAQQRIERSATYTRYKQAADSLFTGGALPEGLAKTFDPDGKRQAQKEASARQLYTRVADEYPKSDWAPRALVARAQIEEKTRDRVMDPSVGTYVPVALPTYRAIAERFPAQSEEALWRMSEIFADLNRYPQQAQALLDLATRFPQSKYDPYWRLGEVREKRLQDKPGAIDAYSKVPSSSSKFRNAEKRVQDLRKK